MKTLKGKAKWILAVIIGTVLITVSCQKSSSIKTSKQSTQMSVYLTDDPAQFDAVLIDIQTVEVKIDTNQNHQEGNFDNNDIDANDDNKGHDQFGIWDTLSISPGVYNIMNLRNGIDTLLGKGGIPAGRINKIRLTLGDNNSIVVDSVSHPLSLFPGTNHFVYVKINEGDHDDQDDNEGNNTSKLWLDFDLQASIKEYNGHYYLRPTIRPFGMKKFGKIEGKVWPRAAEPLVWAIMGQDTAMAIPNKDEGEYKIRGLNPGTYNVWIQGANGYKDTLLSNIVVKMGEDTEIPSITLHK